MTAANSVAPYALPDAQVLNEAGDMPILDESGNSLPLKTLWTGENATSRQLIIFIRHFYCGLCEAYVQELTKELPQTKLDTLSPPVRLTIIGCGSLEPVADYKKRTGCGFPLYCDPGNQIYTKLDMIQSLGMGDKKPEYLKVGMITSTLNSAWNAITAGTNARKAGNFSQNGGELLFESGELKWIHRMQNTRDHAEVNELRQVLKM